MLAWRTNSFWQALTRFQKEKVTPWIALRNTVGMILPLIGGAALGQLPAGLAVATGALNVSWSDSHEPYRVRAKRMLAASVLVGFAVFAGAICGHSRAVTVESVGLWALVAGMSVAVSQTAADLGIISLVTLVVYSSLPQPLERALIAGLLAFAGGLIETALALTSWPLRPYLPERRALSNLFHALAEAAEAPVEVLKAPPASAESTQAQNALASLHERHATDSERYLALLSQAERLRISLLTLARIRERLRRESNDQPAAVILNIYFQLCSKLLAAIAHMLLSGTLEEDANTYLNALPELPDSPAAADARLHMDAATGQLRTALELTASATPEGLEAFDRRESTRPLTLRLRGTIVTLRANLSLDSAAFRHALRLCICCTVATALGYAFSLQRAYWVPMTVAIVLKPDFTATFSRGVLRLAGTFAGLVLATALFHILPDSILAQIALLAVLMYLLRWVGSANYGILVTGVTALVVVLFALAGISPKQVISARAVDTVIGGLIALLAYGLWPTWERRLIPENLAHLLDAYRVYFRAIRERYVNPNASDGHELDRKRMSGRLARSNLEASIDRLTGEPGNSPHRKQLLGRMLATSNRLAHALMALEAGLTTSSPAPARQPFHNFANDVEKTLYYLAAALRGSPLTSAELPDLREDHNLLIRSGDARSERYALVNVETDRITNSLNTLAEQLFEYRGN